jgi:flagellin-like protein
MFTVIRAITDLLAAAIFVAFCVILAIAFGA